MKLSQADRICKILVAAGAVLLLVSAMIGQIIWLYAVGIIVLLCGVVADRKLLRCPHCGKYVGRRRESACPHCGKSLE